MKPLEVTGETDKRGTEVHFLASNETFGHIEFHYEILAKRLRELSFLNNGCKIELIDQRTGKSENFAHAGGVKGFVEYMNRSKTVLHNNIFYAIGEKEGITVEVAMQWNDSYGESVQVFTNNIPQRDGGTHLTGLRSAMTRTINNYIEKEEIAKKAKVETTGDDMREGLTCVLSVKVPEPKFSSQTKDKLVSSEVQPVVQEIVGAEARRLPDGEARRREDHLHQDRRGRARARGRAQGARAHAPQGRARRRRPARQARRLPGARSGAVRALPGRGRFRRRLAPSRAATARTRRSCRSRARSSTSSARASTRSSPRNEVATLITALGAGIGEDFNLEKLRYHRIIIMTDADVDGAHIRTLLLTFFYRQMPVLLEKGHIYVAQPPLYKVKSGKDERYLKDEHELKQHQLRRALQRRRARARRAGAAPLAGEALERIASEYLTTEAVIERLSAAMDSAVLHAMLAMPRISLADKDGATQAAKAFYTRRSRRNAPKTHIERDPTSDGWRLRLEKIVHGNKVETVIDHAFLESGDYAQIVKTAQTLSGLIGEDAQVKRGETRALDPHASRRASTGCSRKPRARWRSSATRAWAR